MSVMPSAVANTGCFSFIRATLSGSEPGTDSSSRVRRPGRTTSSSTMENTNARKFTAPFGETKKGIARSCLLFDSDCLLCAGAVQFVVKYDYEQRFVFMPLQSPKGRHIQAQYAFLVLRFLITKSNLCLNLIRFTFSNFGDTSSIVRF